MVVECLTSILFGLISAITYDILKYYGKLFYKSVFFSKFCNWFYSLFFVKENNSEQKNNTKNIKKEETLELTPYDDLQKVLSEIKQLNSPF